MVYKLESPVSNTMKNSFLIKNSDPSFEKIYMQIKKRHQEKGAEHRAFDQLLTKTNGKRPQARDGHQVQVIHNQMYVFGGDRHHMPFNDFYMLDIAAEVENKAFMFH